LQNAMQSKLLSTLITHSPTALASSISLLVHIKVCHHLVADFRCEVFALVSPCCFSSYILTVLNCKVCNLKLCIWYHVISSLSFVIGRIYHILPYLSTLIMPLFDLLSYQHEFLIVLVLLLTH